MHLSRWCIFDLRAENALIPRALSPFFFHWRHILAVLNWQLYAQPSNVNWTS
jgi:hypothetical protein